MKSMARVFEVKFVGEDKKIHTTHTTAYWMKDAMDEVFELCGYIDIVSCKKV